MKEIIEHNKRLGNELYLVFIDIEKAYDRVDRRKLLTLLVHRLMIATNRNDVLHRLLTSGTYARQDLHQTLSPSMDISISSNFERLMYDLYDRDGGAVARLMDDFSAGAIHQADAAMARARREVPLMRLCHLWTWSC